MVHYQKALLCWKQERERQQDELTLMEESLTEIQGVLADKVLLFLYSVSYSVLVFNVLVFF